MNYSISNELTIQLGDYLLAEWLIIGHLTLALLVVGSNPVEAQFLRKKFPLLACVKCVCNMDSLQIDFQPNTALDYQMGKQGKINSPDENVR